MRTPNHPSLKHENLLPSISNRSPLSLLDDIFLTTWSEAVPTWSGMHRHLRSESLVHYDVTITQEQDPGMTLKQRLAFYERFASRVSKPLCEGTGKNYKFRWHYVQGIYSLLFLSCIKVIRVEWLSLFIAFFVFLQSRTGCVAQWMNTGPAWERNITYKQASQVGLTK